MLMNAPHCNQPEQPETWSSFQSKWMFGTKRWSTNSKRRFHACFHTAAGAALDSGNYECLGSISPPIRAKSVQACSYLLSTPEAQRGRWSLPLLSTFGFISLSENIIAMKRVPCVSIERCLSEQHRTSTFATQNDKH